MFLRSIKGIHITEHPGHKHLSLNVEASSYLNPEYVYIPLVEGSPCECLVKENDQVKVGQVVAMRTGRFGLPVHASVSGVVTAVNKKMWHASGVMVQMIEIKNDFQETLDDSIKKNDVENLSKEQLIEIIKNCGIVGLGGSGFPTYVKYQSPAPISTLIINAAECEPYLTADYTLVTTKTKQFLRGVAYIMRASGAGKAYIAIKENKKEAIQILNEHLSAFANINIFLLKDVYPAGWEKYIVQKIMNKTYKTLPSEVGVVVNNVATAVAICDAVEYNMPLVQKLVTFTGEGLLNPQNVFVKIGTLVNEVIAKIGGYAPEVADAIFVAGGLMTGKGMLFDSLVVHRSLGSIIVLPKEKPGLALPCMGCGKCAENCPVFLSPIQIKQAFDAKNTNLLAELKADKCIQCGLCSYVCPSRIELTEATTKAKALVLKGR
ncbi:MAG: RnfABCDGE type electron transport complex subunit C [Bacilli bacterium]|jgi:electron transport complex protein RnfC|nr:RnfABCDGE type electron transport complex subunit C [Bacilli bacterium]